MLPVKGLQLGGSSEPQNGRRHCKFQKGAFVYLREPTGSWEAYQTLSPGGIFWITRHCGVWRPLDEGARLHHVHNEITGVQ